MIEYVDDEHEAEDVTQQIFGRLATALARYEPGRVPFSGWILRVAHNCGSDYEWGHHERLGLAAGLSAEEIERVREGPGAAGWAERQQLLLRTADELHAERTLSDSLWSELRPLYSDAELIELFMLVGHYEMVAMTLNALRVQPDPVPAGPRPLLARLAERRLRRRS